MRYLAHMDGDREQTVAEHSRSAAERAAGCLRSIGLENAGYLAALLHDFGKYHADFQNYLRKSAAGESVRRGSVIHTHGGARFLLERYHGKECARFDDMTAELLAYAVGAHHGLFDCLDETHRWGFLRRLEWDDTLYQESRQAFFAQCASQEELDRYFAAANQELRPVYDWANEQSGGNGKDAFFHLGLLARLLLSAVIEGDRWDTAQWMANLPAHIPPTPDWSQLLTKVERQLEGFPCDTPIQQARRRISQLCRTAAEWDSGIYRLSVPTGSGKTLASLRYALAHAAMPKHKKSRIIFTAPLLSILEQNVQVLRKYIQNDALILEHHSNVVHSQTNGDDLDPHELMAESWDAPIIITTLVQLLDTLFDGRTTCIRRFQALCNCVLVIDEVQTVPPKMLTLFNLAVGFLSHVCHATVILCSATQPSLAAASHPIPVPIQELVPYDAALWRVFHRSRLVDAGKHQLDEIPALVLERAKQTSSLLVVCNMKRQAQFLYQQCQTPGLRVFHLSAGMCPAHRRAVLKELTAALTDSRKVGPKVICIATQVIEAGVDLSFGGTIRLTAGLDNAIQTAGRGNRNGESKTPACAALITCLDERLERLRDILVAKEACIELLSAYAKKPEAFAEDLASEQSIAQYYFYLYQKIRPDTQDYPMQSGNGTLYDLLSSNDTCCNGQPDFIRFGLHQSFATAGKAFQVFDQDTMDVLVPYKEGEELIAELSSSDIRYDWKRQQTLLQKAKSYTLSLYRFQFEMLQRQGGVYSILDDTVLVLCPQYYDKATGLSLGTGKDLSFLEV